MADVFDEVAKQLGIKRESAIRTYSVSIMAGLQEQVDELAQEKHDLNQALHLLAGIIRSEPPALGLKIESRLKQIALEFSDLSIPVEVTLAALHEAH